MSTQADGSHPRANSTSGRATHESSTTHASSAAPGSSASESSLSHAQDSGATTAKPNPTEGSTTSRDSRPTDVSAANVTTSNSTLGPGTIHADTVGAPDAAATNEANDGSSPASTDVATTTGNLSDRCADANLTWRTGHKTNYESYPDPGSEECIEFNGCYWAGMFAACNDKMPQEWVEDHNIVALFPHFEEFKLHDLCIRRGSDTMIVTVFDTCGDSDCDGCCTENKGSADALIDLEKYTNERWGLPDGDIEWADLGPTQSDGCD